MTERRYREDEVRKIFKLATTQKAADLPSPAAATGFSLAEIQSIGSEAGIEPEAVARAAVALDAPAATPPRTSWGMPIEVGLTVSLPRSITDLEWEQLVAELRATFRATGKITAHGSLREWVNGNLHASVEPTETGSRLRIGTLKGSAAGANAMGAAAIVVAGIMFGTAVGSGETAAFILPSLLSAAGAGTFMTNWLRLGQWRQERAKQMHHIVAKMRAIIGT